MPRRLSDPERLLWEAYARQVKPLEGRDPPAPPPPATREPAPAGPAVPAGPPAAARKPLASARGTSRGVEIGTRQPGLDDTSWRFLSNGRLRPQRTLDLHGRTAQAAFAALHAFLLRAHAERLRCVEIITGVGSGREGGVLRRELPFWLGRNDLHHLVLAAVHPHPGNPGSVRVLLRRGTPRDRRGS